MKATAVIGAGFGDEGKGLATDYFSTKDSVVVRFNGGAQASHTVQTPDGRRHAFSHFGSGSFKGAATFLSEFFIVNPFLWQKELDTLRKLRVNPVLSFAYNCPLTLPYDMLINQEVEKAKGSARHGSCGLGINETVTRCLKPEFTTWASEIVSENTRKRVKDKFLDIRDKYHKERILALGLSPGQEFFDIFNSDMLIENFLNVLDSFTAINRSIVVLSDAFVGKDEIVFEGAQGLMLDEDHSFFPHVTRSKTGLRNVITLAETLEITELDAVYVTRAYMTRHGAGPFPTEDHNMFFEDKTNVPNDFQGTLRFGCLDLSTTADEIDSDLNDVEESEIIITPKLLVTCLDQVDFSPTVINHGTKQVISKDSLVTELAVKCGISEEEDCVYTSYGPTRETVKVFNLDEQEV